MKFIGNGMVWDKEKQKELCFFKNGFYETENEREIALLKEAGYSVDGELELKLKESEVEIATLKQRLEQQGQSGDVVSKLQELTEENEILQGIANQCATAKEILVDKATELGLLNKRDGKKMTIVEIAEMFSLGLKGE